jgi:hypothetical protein
LLSSYRLSGVLKQFEKNLIRLILQFQLDAIAAQLPGVCFQLKDAKTIERANLVG